MGQIIEGGRRRGALGGCFGRGGRWPRRRRRTGQKPVRGATAVVVGRAGERERGREARGQRRVGNVDVAGVGRRSNALAEDGRGSSRGEEQDMPAAADGTGKHCSTAQHSTAQHKMGIG